jgi:hypothetical protein
VENISTADGNFDFSENINWVIALFYQKVINTISSEFSSDFLFHIEYPLTPNPTNI